MSGNPANKFDIILADPPWSYNARNNKLTRFGGGARGHYATMSDAAIFATPVSDIAAPDAVLFLWATWPKLKLAMSVMEAWGFEYKTCGFDWLKVNKGNGLPFFGIGYYSKSNTEPCLLATRGKVLRPSSNKVSMAVVSPRQRHSQKPDEVLERITTLYPSQRKIELFARRTSPGWTSWGEDLTPGVPLLDLIK